MTQEEIMNEAKDICQQNEFLSWLLKCYQIVIAVLLSNSCLVESTAPHALMNGGILLGDSCPVDESYHSTNAFLPIDSYFDCGLT